MRATMGRPATSRQGIRYAGPYEPKRGKRPFWHALTGAGAIVGVIRYSETERCYGLFVEDREAILDAQSLRELGDFCAEKTRAHRASW